MPPDRGPPATHRTRGSAPPLGQFSPLAGRVDYGSITHLQRLKALGDELFMLLTHQLHTEDTHLLTLVEQRVPGACARDFQDHAELELAQRADTDRLATLDDTQTPDEGHAFYLAFTDFHGRYLHLQDIYREQVVTEELLLQHFTDDELMPAAGESCRTSNSRCRSRPSSTSCPRSRTP
jgi:hypothetical protein